MNGEPRRNSAAAGIILFAPPEVPVALGLGVLAIACFWFGRRWPGLLGGGIVLLILLLLILDRLF